MTKDVVKGYAEAVWKGDLSDARKYLADAGFSFDGTLAKYEGKGSADKVIENVKGFRQMVKGVTFLEEVYSGNTASLLYDVATASPAGTIRMAEFYEVSNGKIVKMKLVFDASELRKMMASQ